MSMRRQGINAQLMIIDYYIVSNNYGGMVHEGHLRALEGSFLIQKRPYLPKFMLSPSLLGDFKACRHHRCRFIACAALACTLEAQIEGKFWSTEL